MVRRYLKSSMKVVNSAVGLGGIAIVAYGVLMIRVWQPEHGKGSSTDYLAIPWFFHAFLGVGIALCAISCLGYFAAQTANMYCLSCYISIVLLLLIMETIIMADLFLNPNWRKELPRNLCERLDEFTDFVESSDDILNWVAWLIFLVQGVCVLLATILRTQGANEVDIYESEDEDEQPRHPLSGRSTLRQQVDPSIV
ncbi:Tetraspanin-19 [Striga hermonthica]|uniref:Tetraspanin-19 n=1 Tax=Striga hermonthica TaxID=68872 RepID=A0A9N7MY86_STRHE|nr:Tetraspanin-19 [Striga hermonthica]